VRVKGRRTGALSRYAGSAELADKIRAVLAMSEEQREQLRQKALERVLQRYSWDAVTDAYEALLKKLAE